jgi:predicted SAM-dependent methyltransferase
MIMRMMFGGQIDPYDFHKVGYNPEILTGFLDRAGFENIRKVPAFGLFNDTSNMEFSGRPVSLNVIAEKQLTTDDPVCLLTPA